MRTGVRGESASIVRTDGANDGCVLVPVPADGRVEDAVMTGAALARSSDAALVVVSVVTVPVQTPLSLRARGLTDSRRLAVEAAAVSDVASTRAAVRVGHSVEASVVGAVSDYRADVVVFDAAFDAESAGLAWRSLAARVAERADCSVVTLGTASPPSTVASILLPVAGGPHSTLAATVAGAVADARDAWVEVLHVLDSDATDDERADAEQFVETVRDRLPDPEHASTWVLDAPDVADAIVEQSTYYDLTVLGAPRRSRLRRLVSGSTTGAVRSGAESAVVTARRPTDADAPRALEG